MDSTNGAVTSPGNFGYEDVTIRIFMGARSAGMDPAPRAAGGSWSRLLVKDRLADPRTEAVTEAQRREVEKRHVDLLEGQLRGGAPPVVEVDGDLHELEAVDPGLVGRLAVDGVALDPDPVEVGGLQDGPAVAAVPARRVLDRDPGHERDVLVG